jgi:hypothetical protein
MTTDGWLGWLCFGPCIVLATVQFFGGLYCWYALSRKSPGIRSIDWLDVLWRLEGHFRICFRPDDFPHWRERLSEVTAGELFDVVCRKVQQAGRTFPYGGWHKLRLVLHEALNVPPSRVRRESRLCADLGMD